MKNILQITLILLSLNLSAQKVIDYPKDTSFRLVGLIEIDGHVFINDTCKTPILYIPNLIAVKITDKVDDFEVRECKIKDCKTTHLLLKSRLIFSGRNWNIHNDDIILYSY